MIVKKIDKKIYRIKEECINKIFINKNKILLKLILCILSFRLMNIDKEFVFLFNHNKTYKYYYNIIIIVKIAK